MFDKLVLEKTCSECNGSGALHGSRCPDCNGKRYVATEFGEAIMSFVLRQLRD